MNFYDTNNYQQSLITLFPISLSYILFKWSFFQSIYTFTFCHNNFYRNQTYSTKSTILHQKYLCTTILSIYTCSYANLKPTFNKSHTLSNGTYNTDSSIGSYGLCSYWTIIITCLTSFLLVLFIDINFLCL